MLLRATVSMLLLAAPSVALAAADCEDVAANPDWDKAFRFQTVAEGGRLVVEFEVAPCFHAYGPKTPSGQPLALELLGHAFRASGPAKMPSGIEEKGPFGRRVVIRGKGRIVLPIERRDAEAEKVKAKLHYHVCTDTACGPPRHVSFSAKAG